jgi:hypothetical protein
MPAPTPPADPLESWPAYYAALLSADKKWAAKYGEKMGIFSGQNSYLLTSYCATAYCQRLGDSFDNRRARAPASAS